MAAKNTNKPRPVKQGKKPTIKSEFGPFTVIPTSFIDQSKDLNYSAKWIYVILLRHYNHKTEKCFPSWDRLQELSGLSRDAVYRGINDLCATGWITKKVIPGVKTEYVIRTDRMRPRKRQQPARNRSEEGYENKTPYPSYDKTLTKVSLNKREQSESSAQQHGSPNASPVASPPPPPSASAEIQGGGGKPLTAGDLPATKVANFIAHLRGIIPIINPGDENWIRWTAEALLLSAGGDENAAWARVVAAKATLFPEFDIYKLRAALGMNNTSRKAA